MVPPSGIPTHNGRRKTFLHMKPSVTRRCCITIQDRQKETNVVKHIYLDLDLFAYYPKQRNPVKKQLPTTWASCQSLWIVSLTNLCNLSFLGQLEALLQINLKNRKGIMSLKTKIILTYNTYLHSFFASMNESSPLSFKGIPQYN